MWVVKRNRVTTAILDADKNYIVELVQTPELAEQIVRDHAAMPALLAVLKMVVARWTFDNHQQHTHSWHDWADVMAVVKPALDAAEEPHA